MFQMPRTVKDVPRDERAGNILNLDQRDLAYTQEICKGNIEYEQVANLLFNSHQAKGTSKIYGQVIAKFREHCDSTDGYDYDNFGEAEVGSFVLRVAQENLSKNMIACIKPAIERLEVAKGVKNTAFTPLICKWLSGAKRLACEIEPQIKKMDPIPMEAIKKALKDHIWIHLRDIEQIDLKVFRTVFRWVVMAFTLCRFDDFNELRALDFKVLESQEAIQVFFPRSKNDQFHNGMIKMLPQQANSIINPMALALLYFKRFGFHMDGSDTSYINCRISGNSVKKVRGEVRLSYGEASKLAKSLLSEIGYGHIRYGESSAKRTGVTVALNQEVPIDVVQQVGGWRTTGMPLTYMSSSVDHKVKIAKDMKIR